ncbi:MAG: exo-alpha-sialidase [Planctomycetaceae bacterium]|nr:exo-alpha-sialidase [Planctomycetaceae bacterium]
MTVQRRFNRTAIKLVIAAILLMGSWIWWPPRSAIEVRTVAGPGVPGKYKHASSACELADGRILLVYYSGSGEYGRDTAIYGTELDRKTEHWSRPRIIADEPSVAEGNPTLWRSPQGRIWLFYPLRPGETWASAQLVAKISEDEGRTWSDAPPPTDRPGYMTRARPITLADGSCLLPADLNPSIDPEVVSAQSASLFFRSNPELTAWTASPLIPSRLGNHQPAVAQADDERLVAYCRRGGDYFGRDDGRLVRSESRDGGATWSDGAETEFPNPNAPVAFDRLQSGSLLLVFNNSTFERTPLVIAISRDGDRTYPDRYELAGEEYSYPCILQASDGEIYVFFTAGARSHIRYVRFHEWDVSRQANRA